MPTQIHETLQLPGAAGAQLRIRYDLVDENAEIIDGIVEPDITIVGQKTTTDLDGEYTITLYSPELILPANAVYRRRVFAGAVLLSTMYISFPDVAGPLEFQDYITNLPGSLDPSGLTVHAALRGAGGHLPDGPLVEGQVPKVVGGVVVWADDETGGGGGGFTEEQIEDIVGLMAGGTQTGISVVYDDASDHFDFIAEVTQAELDALAGTIPTTEGMQDLVGAMLGGTQTGIAVTYNDPAGMLSFVAEVTQAELDAVAAAITAEAATRLAADNTHTNDIAALDTRIDAYDALGSLATDAELAAAISGLSTVYQPLDADLTALAAAGNSAVLAATTASFLTAHATKLGHITVTQAVDLDVIEARVNDLDAAVVLRGSWDASAGTFPGGGTAQAGSSYIVSVAGTVNGVAFAQNDRIVAITDNASTTTYASNWLKLDYTDQVLSVDGRTGAVTLNDLYAPIGEPIAAAHIADASDAHDASSISVLDSGGFFADSDVESVLAFIGDWIDTTPDINAIGRIIYGTPNPGDLSIDMSIGKAGGETFMGGTGSGDNLLFETTPHATKGYFGFKDAKLYLRPGGYTTTAGVANYGIQWEGAIDATVGAPGDGSNSFFGFAFAPTVLVAGAGPLTEGSLFADSSSWRNAPGVAASGFGASVFAVNRTYTADDAAYNPGNLVGYQSKFNFGRADTVADSGTMTVAQIQHLTTSTVVGVGATITELIHLNVGGATGAGTITAQTGIVVPALTGTSAWGIRVGKATTAAIDLTGSDGTAATGIRAVDSATTIHRSASGVWTATGKWFVTGELEVDGAFNHDGTTFGVFGVTPATQRSAYTQTYSTADRTHANDGSGDLTGIASSTTGTALAEPGASYAQSVQQQNFRRIQDQYNLLRATVTDLKQLVNSVIDDLQAFGFAT